MIAKWEPGFGQFETVMADLTIPCAGLPLTIRRVHNNRLSKQGDFGWNWTLDIRLISVGKSPGPFDAGWLLSPLQNNRWLLQATEPHLISVKAPGRTFDYEFQACFANGSLVNRLAGQPELVEEELYARLVGPQGFQGGLSAIPPFDELGVSDPTANLTGGPVTLFAGTYQDCGPIPFTGEYEFTMPDGRILHILDEVGVDYVRDRNGNRVNYYTNRTAKSV